MGKCHQFRRGIQGLVAVVNDEICGRARRSPLKPVAPKVAGRLDVFGHDPLHVRDPRLPPAEQAQKSKHHPLPSLTWGAEEATGGCLTWYERQPPGPWLTRYDRHRAGRAIAV